MAMGIGSKRQTTRHPAAIDAAVLALLCCGSGAGCASTPRPMAVPADLDRAATSRRSLATERQSVALTVYNSNFALVREERRLSLGTGRVALAYKDVSAH